jgi:hypothetical protein
MLTPAARETLDVFRTARSGPMLERLSNLRRSGVYRQSRVGQLFLYAAGVLGKL